MYTERHVLHPLSITLDDKYIRSRMRLYLQTRSFSFLQASHRLPTEQDRYTFSYLQ